MKKKRGRVVVAVSLLRLRIAFIALGVILLCGLFALSWFVEERLAEARRDREEMVAARVFDEMEREISAFLEGESERPHYENLESTNPETWAPFVVGYFAGAHPEVGSPVRLVAAEGTTSENRRRTRWAIEQAQKEFDAPVDDVRDGAPSVDLLSAPALPLQVAPLPSPVDSAKKDAAKKDAAPKGSAPLEQQKQATGSEIIQQLNRAPERRKLKQPAPKQEESPDAFSDYSERF